MSPANRTYKKAKPARRRNAGAAALAFAIGFAGAAIGRADQPVAVTNGASGYPGTRSITLPGTPPPNSVPPPDRSKKTADADAAAAVPAPQEVAASLALAQTAGAKEAEPHYETAVVALKDGNLAIAAEEMSEAAKLSPENVLVLYGLAVVEARNQQPELALPNIEKALQLGLPVKESAEATNLVTAIRYAIKKDEAEQKRVTPAKLWGSYDAPLTPPVQDFEERAGRTIFRTTLPVSRQMFLWKIQSESTLIGHWIEKDTRTEETIYKDSRRHDAHPKSVSEEHWWLLTILINPDGSLDGSRLQTCFREAGKPCETGSPDKGKVVAFKGHVEPNGDLTVVQDDGATLTLKKKSRVTSLPPSGVGINVE